GGPAGGHHGEVQEVGEPVVAAERPEALPHPLHDLADGRLTQAEAGGHGDGRAAVAGGALVGVGQPHGGVAGAGDQVERGGQLGRPGVAGGHPAERREDVLHDVGGVDGGGGLRSGAVVRRVAGGDHLVER